MSLIFKISYCPVFENKGECNANCAAFQGTFIENGYKKIKCWGNYYRNKPIDVLKEEVKKT